MANQFTLRGHHTEIHYTVGGNPDLIAMTYEDEIISRDFKPRDIHTDQTALGALISVRLEERSTDNHTVFAFFLPSIAVPQDQAADFTTAGIHQEHVKQGTIPYRPDTWRPFIMHGVAKNVIVAL